METEVRIRHQDGELFIPDLVVHKDDQNIVVADVQVSWLRANSVHGIYEAKRTKYGRGKFLQAARKNWPGKRFEFAPVILGARGIWPRVNEPSEKLLSFNRKLKSNCVHSTLKWGSTIHRNFMAGVWKRSERPAPMTSQLVDRDGPGHPQLVQAPQETPRGGSHNYN
jgi:hypothetical protein